MVKKVEKEEQEVKYLILHARNGEEMAEIY